MPRPLTVRRPAGRTHWLLAALLAVAPPVLSAQEAGTAPSGEPADVAADMVATSQVPQRSPSGQTLEIAEAELDLGMPYYVLSGEDTQLVVRSEAPLQSLTAIASRAVGYFVAPFDVEELGGASGSGELGAERAPLRAGALRLPVASLTTGAPAADRMIETQLLRAAEYPEIGFLLRSVSEVRRLEDDPEEPSAVRFALTAHGQLEFVGTSAPFAVPVELTFHGATNQTMSRYVGQLASIEASFDFSFDAFGIQLAGPMLSRVSNQVEVDLYLMLTNVSPDRPLVPLTPEDQHVTEALFVTKLRDLDEGSVAYRLGAEYLETIWDDAEALNRMAFYVLAEPGIEDRRPAFALRAARRAVELTERRDGLKLNTLARAQFEVGEVEGAIATQKAAIALAEESGGNPQALAQLQANLARYESATE